MTPTTFQGNVCNMGKVREISIDGNRALVPLTSGFTAVIDASDVHLVEGRNWYAMPSRRANGDLRAVYAASRGGKGTVLLHRVITDAAIGAVVDHLDGDGRNNTRANLRVCTPGQNAWNARLRVDNKSGAKGVTFCKRTGKWIAHIAKDGKKKYLGRFETVAVASRAYRVASQAMHGEFASC